MVDCPHTHKHPANPSLAVRVPNGAVLRSSHVATLALPGFSPAACQAHIFPGLASHPLLSIGQLCDDGCTATFLATLASTFIATPPCCSLVPTPPTLAFGTLILPQLPLPRRPMPSFHTHPLPTALLLSMPRSSPQHFPRGARHLTWAILPPFRTFHPDKSASIHPAPPP
jgi:hypothetical protein